MLYIFSNQGLWIILSNWVLISGKRHHSSSFWCFWVLCTPQLRRHYFGQNTDNMTDDIYNTEQLTPQLSRLGLVIVDSPLKA